MTQTQLAEIAGASKHAQIKWEKGDAYPNAAVLSTWAAAGMDVLYVLTGVRANVPSTAHLPSKEQVILDAYRAGTVEQQDFILKAALGFAGTSEPSARPQARPRDIRQKAKKVTGIMMAGGTVIDGSRKKN